jgi:hypothetical protein
MRSRLPAILAAFILTIATAWINPATDERAMYGMEGRPEENWKPRAVAGWPAPYLADSPSTSVLHQVGPEDVFRPGPFIATLSFWYLVALTVLRALAGSRNGRR